MEKEKKDYVNSENSTNFKDVLHEIYDLADKLNIEHPEKDKYYEELTVPETILDVVKSLGTEASHILVPKDKEKQYDSKTISGETTIKGKTLKQSVKELVSSDKYLNLPDYNANPIKDSKMVLINDLFANYSFKAKQNVINSNLDCSNNQGQTLYDVRQYYIAKRQYDMLQDNLAHSLSILQSRGQDI